MAKLPDYTILHAPRITEAKFTAVLRKAGSPATREAAACYRAAAVRGVDPAVLLAMFRKESTFGRFGHARPNKSWGNLRRSPDYPSSGSGGFVKYPTWAAGAGDAARLLAIYGRNQIRPGKNTSTVQTMPYVWAPAADGNGPDRYGDQLASWIKGWTGDPGTGVAADRGGSPTGGGSGAGSGVGAGATVSADDLGAFYLNGRPIVTYPRGSTAWTANGIIRALHAANYFGQGGLVPELDLGAGAAEDVARAVFKADEGRPWNEALHAEWARELGNAAIAAGDPLGGLAAAVAGIPAALEGLAKNAVALAAILGLVVLALYRIVKP